MLPDGTAIADFSEAMATSIPSGIQSEQMAVDSIAKTLEANVPQVRWLKILIHGQEVDTLAGHLDLTRTFLVNAKATPMQQSSAPAQKSAGTPALDSANPLATQLKSAPATASGAASNKPAGTSQKLTPSPTTGKLAPPAKKP
jgi:hypothetical protein